MKVEDITFFSEDLNKELTVKDYLKELLKRLWLEKECFSGKRPFGNSGWDYDLEKALVIAKVIKGKFDEDGEIEESDDKKFNKTILKCIESL